jgi:hypothetical protein
MEGTEKQSHAETGESKTNEKTLRKQRVKKQA